MHKFHSTPGAITVKPGNMMKMLGIGGALLALAIPAKADAAVSKARLQGSITAAYRAPVAKLLDRPLEALSVTATAACAQYVSEESTRCAKRSTSVFDLKFKASFRIQGILRSYSWYGEATVKRGNRSTRVPRLLDNGRVRLTANQFATVASW